VAVKAAPRDAVAAATQDKRRVVAKAAAAGNHYELC
jgi:hypothetical protein